MGGTGGTGPHRGERGPDRRGRRPGTEPLTARSPLRLRAIMSVIALTVAAAAAIGFAVASIAGAGPGAWTAAGLCAAVAVIAAIDLVVIARRARP